MIFALPRPHQHKKLAKKGSASRHPHKHLTEVDKDGHLEDGVGCEVLELKPELRHEAWFHPPLFPLEARPVTRKSKAVAGLSAGDHPVSSPVLLPRTAKGGNVGHYRI